ncbi:hypothetical protein KY290_011396 [Solanum tuberosum]|uniref:Uncharacterized protein n=1 Tax=Solanum tuberosum TaxID=4113 RepID=A0ABQ7W0I1_SOLTU|nr:hypothetical protein KY290_011396 [Solanum tuberosum]
MKSPSASVIDGVFCSLDDSLQITVYDSIHKCFWALKLPDDMETGKVWVKKYVGNVANTVLQCPEDFGLEGYNWFEMTSIAIHPTVPHMFYLSFLGCRPTQYFKFFPYEWHQWPPNSLI